MTERGFLNIPEKCECCGRKFVSDWNKEAYEQALCDLCFEELYRYPSDDFIFQK